MSYNLIATIYDRLSDDGIWMTEPTELLDSILSGQNYSEAHYNYQRTHNSSEVLREQMIAIMENRNKAYLQLLAFTTNGFLQQLPEIISDPNVDADDYDDWEAINLAHASSNFTVDELLNLESQLSIDLDDATEAIGQYTPDTLQVIIGFVSRMRHSYEADPSLQNIEFSIG